MAISTFPPAGGAGGNFLAYKATPGVQATVNVPAGFYLIESTFAGKYPITLGSSEISASTQFVDLPSNATTLDFQEFRDDFEQITIPSGPTPFLYDIHYANGVAIIQGNNSGIWRSTDFVNWTLVFSDNSVVDIDEASISYGNNTWVIVGKNGGAYSTDNGLTWTPNSASDGRHVHFDNGTFLKVQDTDAAISTDGINWTTKTVPTGGNLFSCIYADGLFVVAGSGSLFTSSDANTWTSRSASATEIIWDFEYANNLFVGVGKGIIYTSADGITWTSRSLPPNMPTGLNEQARGVVFGNNLWMLVTLNGYVGLSDDGINWDREDTSLTITNAQQITFGDNTFGIVGFSYGVEISDFPSTPQYLVLQPAQLTDLT